MMAYGNWDCVLAALAQSHWAGYDLDELGTGQGEALPGVLQSSDPPSRLVVYSPPCIHSTTRASFEVRTSQSHPLMRPLTQKTSNATAETQIQRG